MATVEERLARLEARVEEHSQLFGTMREALLAFEHRMDVRFDGIERRFDAVDRRFEAIDRRFEVIDHRGDGKDAAEPLVQAFLAGVTSGLLAPGFAVGCPALRLGLRAVTSQHCRDGTQECECR